MEVLFPAEVCAPVGEEVRILPLYLFPYRLPLRFRVVQGDLRPYLLLAEKTGLTTNYISTVERGMSFPRCEKLIILLNGLETSADSIFCDVLEHSGEAKASELSKKIADLPPEAQKRILQMVELMIQQEKDNMK